MEVTTSCAKSQNDGHHVEVKRRPVVPITLHLTREQLEIAERLASKSGVRYQTVLKKLIADGLRSWERAVRLKNWQYFAGAPTAIHQGLSDVRSRSQP